MVSGIVYVIKHGLQWKDAPTGCRPHKTLHNRFIRWSCMGVFDRIFGRLKDQRCIATRYDRYAHAFFSAICIAATVAFWL